MRVLSNGHEYDIIIFPLPFSPLPILAAEDYRVILVLPLVGDRKGSGLEGDSPAGGFAPSGTAAEPAAPPLLLPTPHPHRNPTRMQGRCWGKAGGADGLCCPGNDLKEKKSVAFLNKQCYMKLFNFLGINWGQVEIVIIVPLFLDEVKV